MEKDITPVELQAIVNDPNTIIFKLVPTKECLPKLKEMFGDEDVIYYSMTVGVNKGSVEQFEQGVADFVGLFIINDELLSVEETDA